LLSCWHFIFKHLTVLLVRLRLALAVSQINWTGLDWIHSSIQYTNYDIVLRRSTGVFLRSEGLMDCQFIRPRHHIVNMTSGMQSPSSPSLSAVLIALEVVRLLRSREVRSCEPSGYYTTPNSIILSVFRQPWMNDKTVDHTVHLHHKPCMARRPLESNCLAPIYDIINVFSVWSSYTSFFPSIMSMSMSMLRWHVSAKRLQNVVASTNCWPSTNS